MLVITRKLDQSIIVNGNIEIMVIGLGKDGVRLGIKAPRDVQVHRREVFDAIAELNRAATAQTKVGAIGLFDRIVPSEGRTVLASGVRALLGPLADRLGVSVRLVRLWEHGKQGIPFVHRRRLLAIGLQESPGRRQRLVDALGLLDQIPTTLRGWDAPRERLNEGVSMEDRGWIKP